MKNNKKKGFTLIELIAVIAILAILGMILIPNIMTYRKKAEKQSIRSSAQTILNAINVYNSDQDADSSLIGDSTTDYPGTVDYATGLTNLVTAGTLKQADIPACLGGPGAAVSGFTVTKVSELESVAKGNFEVDKVSGLTSGIVTR